MQNAPHSPRRPLVPLVGTILLTAGLVTTGALPASAAGPTAPDLGTAASYSVLAASEVTNVGASALNGDLGVTGTTITGFPLGSIGGGLHFTDPAATQAQSDLTTAYLQAAALPPTNLIPIGALDSQTLVGGTYSDGAMSLGVGGTVILDGEAPGGASSSVWVFQAASDLTIGANSTVSLINGANPCNVFWQVTSSASIGTGAAFVGTVMALTAVTVGDSASINGRLLARNANVTLLNNSFTGGVCAPTTSTGPLPTGVTISTSGAGAGQRITGIYGPGATPGVAPAAPGGPAAPAAVGPGAGLVATGAETDALLAASLATTFVGAALLVIALRRRRLARPRP